MKINFGFIFIGSMIFVTSCYTSQKSPMSSDVSYTENNEVAYGSSWGQRDTALLDPIYDSRPEGGVFGRKIIYRDLSATKGAINVSGIIAVKVCINRDGIVTYTEILGDETTIRDRAILKRYLKAARGYKFQPDLTAPKEQCGKLRFTIDNSAYK